MSRYRQSKERFGGANFFQGLASTITDQSISNVAFRLYCLLAYEGGGHDVTVAHASLAQRLGVSVPTIKRAKAELEDAGLLISTENKIGPRSNAPCTYTLLEGGGSSVNGGSSVTHLEAGGGSSVTQGVGHPRPTNSSKAVEGVGHPRPGSTSPERSSESCPSLEEKEPRQSKPTDSLRSPGVTNPEDSSRAKGQDHQVQAAMALVAGAIPTDFDAFEFDPDAPPPTPEPQPVPPKPASNGIDRERLQEMRDRIKGKPEPAAPQRLRPSQMTLEQREAQWAEDKRIRDINIARGKR